MQIKYKGNVALIPFLSDSYYTLLRDLITTSQKYPKNISFPAGVIIIAVACVESYINELIYMWTFKKEPKKNSRIKKSLEKYGTDILKKLSDFKKYAKDPDELSDDLIDDLRLLLALRGRIVHYTVQEEYLNDKDYLSKLQKLEKHLFTKSKNVGSVNTERILSPSTAEIAGKIVFEVVLSLYKCGYEPPRPRWVELIDPERFNKGRRRSST